MPNLSTNTNFKSSKYCNKFQVPDTQHQMSQCQPRAPPYKTSSGPSRFRLPSNLIILSHQSKIKLHWKQYFT